MLWQEEPQRWLVRTDRGDAFRARYVVLSGGPFVRPRMPGTVLDPDGGLVGRFVTPLWDSHVTNLCFGASGVAYLSSGGRGRLYEVPWPWPVLRLNFQP
ncbi:MAG: hypothetical protein L0I76_10095 [Pseudonocardia sp.]|nr:hypothetical protein [Pseudonocardia sp.]